VGVLHDTVEKTPRTYADLRREGFSKEVIAAVERLTKRDGEAYLDYIGRTAKDALAKRVKRADLQDHLNLLRGHRLSASEKERRARYRQAMHALLESGGP
jgi:(p)ppGpp synthase/HD superfamily hydrolase